MIEPPGALVAMALDAVARHHLDQRPAEQHDHGQRRGDQRRAGLDRARDASGSDSRGHPPASVSSMTGPAKAPWLMRHGRSLLLVLLLAAIELSYVAIISAGAFTTWPTWNNELRPARGGVPVGPPLHVGAAAARAAREGRPVQSAWRSLWFWDASLYDGHYYLYWGPFPAVVLALFKSVFRIRGHLGDQYPLFAFYTIHLVAGALLIVRMAQRLFDRAPPALTALAHRRVRIREPDTLHDRVARHLRGRDRGRPGVLAARSAGRVRGALARGSTGCAGGCWSRRASPGASPSAAARAPRFPPRSSSRSPRWRSRRRSRDAACLAAARASRALDGAPIAAVVAAQLAYNKLRFGGWFDFGLSKQLSTMNFRSAPAFLVPTSTATSCVPCSPPAGFPSSAPRQSWKRPSSPISSCPVATARPSRWPGCSPQPPGCCWPGWRPCCWRARSARRAAPPDRSPVPIAAGVPASGAAPRFWSSGPSPGSR